MDDKRSLSHTKWECRYHLVWIPTYRKKELYGGLRKTLGHVPRTSPFKGDSNFRRASDARPCGSVDLDSSQVFGFSCGKISQRQECHSNCPGVSWEKQDFCESSFIGLGVFCFHQWMNEERIRAYIRA